MTDNDEIRTEGKVGADIGLLIDKKISDAKLNIAEKLLHIVLTAGGLLLVLFGIIFPIYMSQKMKRRSK